MGTPSFGGRKAMDRLQNADATYNPQQEPQRTNAVVSPSRIRELQKLAGILELLELMEEAHKDNTWILDQIKKNHLKIPVKQTMGPVSILKNCHEDFVSHLTNVIKFSDLDGTEQVPPLTSTYHWFFTDIVASSDPTITTNEQARKISVLNKLIERTEVWRKRDSDTTLTLPTGDGMAIGFSDSPEKPLLLAIQTHKDINSRTAKKQGRGIDFT